MPKAAVGEGVRDRYRRDCRAGDRAIAGVGNVLGWGLPVVQVYAPEKTPE